MLNILDRIKNKVLRVLLQRRLFGRPNSFEKEQIETLRRDVQKISWNENSMPEWMENQKILKMYILEKDPRDFINWPVIRATMFHNGRKVEIGALKRSPRWSSLYKNNIEEDAVGNPPRYLKSLTSSGNLIGHLYSLEQLYLHAKSFDLKRIRNIFEFGGGYGSLARLVYRLGFKGKYTLYDFEIFHALQKYFLRSSSVSNYINNITFANNPKEVREGTDVLVSLWALSESPVSLRNQILEKVCNTKYILIGYQYNFGGIDNRKYFKEVQTKYNEFNWIEYDIPYLPGNRYLIGYKL